MQQDRRVGRPADIYLVTPIDAPFRAATLVLSEHGHDLTAGRLDLVSGAVAQIAQLPDHALELVQPRGGAGLFAQADLFRAQRDPDLLTGREPAHIINPQV